MKPQYLKNLDAPSHEFLERLRAFRPESTSAEVTREMAELLLILNDAPLFVKNCLENYFKGDIISRAYVMRPEVSAAVEAQLAASLPDGGHNV